jgi:hypothetical protein
MQAGGEEEEAHKNSAQHSAVMIPEYRSF